ncbi:MAG: hypothetical protein Q9197_002515 [Variospora fuerteventurae]
MAPREKPKAKRRWTLTRTQDLVEESSEEDYGEEILPTVDQDALATLAPEDQDKFRKMRKKDRKNVIARWRREGRPVPKSRITDPLEGSEPLARSSSAPQLPELQMDVTPRETFSNCFDKVREPSPGIEHRSIWQILRPDQSDPEEHPHWQQDHRSLPASPHKQGLPHDRNSAHTSLIAYPSLESEDIGQASLWSRILDTTEHTRGRRGAQGLLQDPADPAAARSSGRETPETRRLRQLQDADTALREVIDYADLEYARFRGHGPLPPGLALASNTPSASERVHAQTITSVNDVLRATGQVTAHDAVTAARQAANQAPAMDLSESHFLTVRENLFVRPSQPITEDDTTAKTWQRDARIQNIQLSPLTTAKREMSARQYAGETTGDDATPEEQKKMQKLKTSPMKRMARAMGAGIGGLCKGKAEKATRRGRNRPLSRLRLHNEARVGTAAMVSVTAIKAPQPTHHLPRAPPPLRPTPSLSASPNRRTTRAMMENYD